MEKIASSSYSKKEIGQSHNHLQWIKDKKKEFKLLGLAIIGDCTKVDGSASPSDQMFFVPKETIKNFTSKIRDLLRRIELQTPIERRGSINALKEATEYTMKKYGKC